MKRMFLVLCIAALLLAGIPVSTVRSAEVKTENIPITSVSDISVYSSYTPPGMQFKEVKYLGKEIVFSFSIPKAAILMLNVNNYDVKTSVISGNQLASVSVTPLTFTLTMDAGRVNRIREFTSVTSGFYGGPIYLDQGTYYLFVKATNLNSRNYANGSFHIGALVQYGNSMETVKTSYMANPNMLANRTMFRTFVSDVATEDWWQFQVPEKAMYDFKFLRFSGKGQLQASLLDSKGVSVRSVNVENAYSEAAFSEYLQPGKYFIKVQSTSTNGGAGGDVTCEFSRTVYEVDSKVSKKKPTNQDVTLTVKANFPVAQSCLLREEEEPEMTDEIAASQTTWKRAVSTGTDTLLVRENGTYWIIAKDARGNVAYQSIKISNIDKKAPNKPSVSTPKLKKKYVSGKGEKGATVYVTFRYVVDGNTVTKKYKGTVDQETKKFSVPTRKITAAMTIEVYLMDAAGNESERVTFNMQSISAK